MGALLQQAQMMQKKMQEVENKLRTMEVEGIWQIDKMFFIQLRN